jgi:hypothetical protein
VLRAAFIAGEESGESDMSVMDIWAEVRAELSSGTDG